MKVNYYFRKPMKGNYSIENVFENVQNNLPAGITSYSIIASRPMDIGFSVKLKFQHADIHHITGAINYAALSLPANRTILTIHDLGHLTETLQGIKKDFYKFLFWTWPFRKIKYLTTISEFTQREVRKNFNVQGKKIKTIYNPISLDFNARPNRRNECPVILQVGGGSNKNIENLIEAVIGLPCKLLLVRQPSTSLVSLLQRNGIDHEFRNGLTKQQLIQCYEECDLLFFASTYEGFGLPIIEAMACGRPVITSTIDPMREISGDSALLVDWKSSREIRNGINRLWTNQSLYSELQAKGFERAKKFNPRRITEEYLDFYDNVLAHA
jgi:glycosyltransferase involved in cell wall biosynthesis